MDKYIKGSLVIMYLVIVGMDKLGVDINVVLAELIPLLILSIPVAIVAWVWWDVTHAPK